MKSQSNKFIVGITGGIGSGKTAVTDWLKSKSVDVVDADVIAHQIVATGSETLNEMATVFGEWILTESGSLNRAVLREHVFHNPDDLQKLERITHPAIRREIILQLEKAQSDYVVLSAPLLLEAGTIGLARLCDYIVVVDVLEHVQLERASNRDGQRVEQIKAVMSKQLSRAERNVQADEIIDNNGSLDDLRRRVDILHETLLLRSHQG